MFKQKVVFFILVLWAGLFSAGCQLQQGEKPWQSITLDSIELSAGKVTLEDHVFDYTLAVPNNVGELGVTPVAPDADLILVNGTDITAGESPAAVPLKRGVENVIRITLVSPVGTCTLYTLRVRINSIKKQTVVINTIDTAGNSSLYLTEFIEYDEKQRIMMLSYFYPDDSLYYWQDYEYAADDKLLWVTRYLDGVVQIAIRYTYTDTGLLERQTVYFGDQADESLESTMYYEYVYEYNEQGKCSRNLLSYYNGVTRSAEYAYRLDGKIDYINYVANSSGTITAYSHDYSYNERGKLKRISTQNDPNNYSTLDYTYDERGNTKTYRVNFTDGQVTEYLYTYTHYDFSTK